jgi:hypothetical protein
MNTLPAMGTLFGSGIVDCVGNLLQLKSGFVAHTSLAIYMAWPNRFFEGSDADRKATFVVWEAHLATGCPDPQPSD